MREVVKTSIPKLHSIRYKNGGCLRPVDNVNYKALEHAMDLLKYIKDGKFTSFAAVVGNNDGDVRTIFAKNKGLGDGEMVGWCETLKDRLMESWRGD